VSQYFENQKTFCDRIRERITLYNYTFFKYKNVIFFSNIDDFKGLLPQYCSYEPYTIFLGLKINYFFSVPEPLQI